MRSPFNSPHRSSSRLSFRFGSTVIILLVTFFFIFLLFFDQLRPLPCPHSLVAKLPGTFQQESLFLLLFFIFRRIACLRCISFRSWPSLYLGPCHVFWDMSSRDERRCFFFLPNLAGQCTDDTIPHLVFQLAGCARPPTSNLS